MVNFNKNFFQPKTEYTREMAEARLTEKGFSGFRFTGASHSNGASFYFDGANGEKIRVSDHRLTGRRAFGVIQVDLVEAGSLSADQAVLKKREAEIEAFRVDMERLIARITAKKNQKN